MLTALVQHYSFRKQLAPDSTFACIVMPGYLMPVLEILLSGMSYFKRFTKGAAPIYQSTRSGSMATRPVYVFTDVTSAADQAVGHEHCVHKLHNAIGVSAASDSDFETDNAV